MNKYIYIITLLIASMLLFTNCSDDDSDVKAANVTLKNAEQITGGGLSKTVIKFYDDKPLQLIPFIMPTNAANKSVEYEVIGNTNILSITSDGLMTANAPGLDTIVVRTLDGSGVKTTYPVEILDHVIAISSVTFADAPAKIGIAGNPVDFKSLVIVNPANAFGVSLRFESSNEAVATVDPETGIVTPIAEGIVDIKVIASNLKGTADAIATIEVVSNVSRPVNYDRAGWVISKTSHPYAPDGTTGKPEDLFDSDKNTFLSLFKSKEGQTNVPVGDPVYIILDMGEAKKVEFVMMSYREKVPSKNLRLKTGTLFGSTDNVNFVQIGEAGRVFDEDTLDNTFLIDEADIKEYRYIKLSYDSWNDAGMTVQFSEMNVGYVLSE